MIVFSAGMATVYVRYKQVEALAGHDELKLQRLNRFGLLLGLISSFGMCVVANFQVSAAGQGSVHARVSEMSNVSAGSVCVCLSEQKTTLFAMHLVGAVLTFGVGALYILVQTLISLYMQPHVHSRTVYLVRLGIGLWTLGSIISSILKPVDSWSPICRAGLRLTCMCKCSSLKNKALPLTASQCLYHL